MSEASRGAFLVLMKRVSYRIMVVGTIWPLPLWRIRRCRYVKIGEDALNDRPKEA